MLEDGEDQREAEDPLEVLGVLAGTAGRDSRAELAIRDNRANRDDQVENILKTTSEKSAPQCSEIGYLS